MEYGLAGYQMFINENLNLGGFGKKSKASPGHDFFI